MHESVSGPLQVPFLRMAVAQYNKLRKEGEGKAGASRRGKTSSSSGQDEYWV